MKLTGIKSPGRRATRDKLRALAAPIQAKSCPDIFATDKEFMRLFRASKALEGNRKRKLEFLVLKNRLRARGIYLEHMQRDGSVLVDASGVYNG